MRRNKTCIKQRRDKPQPVKKALPFAHGQPKQPADED